MVLGRLVLAPASDYERAIVYDFPAEMSLEDWQFQTAEAPEGLDVEYLIDAETYQYQQGDRTLTAQMVYLSLSNGDVVELLQTHADVPASAVDQVTIQQTGDQYYALLVDEENQTLHISACLAANGESTVTEEQFQATRRLSRLTFPQQVEWFFGRRRIEDYRCLWVLLSMPITSDVTQDQAMLESAWQAWHQQWQQDYPL